MTENYFPFDAGAGADVTEAEWRKMARLWRGTGVYNGWLNNLEVYGDSSGMQVKLKTGAAWVDGFFYENDAELILAVGAAHPTYGRIDRAIIRLDPSANTVTAAILAGTPSASPVAPTLTQSSTGVYEIGLATITVPAAATYITAGNVTDTRTYSYASTSGNLGIEDYSSGVFAVSSSSGSVSYTKAHGLGAVPRLVTLEHSLVASPGSGDLLIQMTTVIAASTNVNSPAVSFDGTNIIVATGTNTSYGTCYAPNLGGARLTNSGYWRIRAWK